MTNDQAVRNSVRSVDAQGRGLCVEFIWSGDRWLQQVSLLDGEQAAMLMQSTPGPDASETDWAAVYQDLHVQTIEGRQVAGLVGMSGHCHWSLTVEQVERDGRPALLFDAACRMKQPTARVGNQYELAAGVQLEEKRLTTPLGEVPIVTAEPALEIAGAGELVAISRAAEAPTILPATVQWRYELALPT